MLKVLKWVSAVSVFALALWLALLITAITAADNHKEASVFDRTGRMVVTGKNYVILTQEHWF